MVARYEAPSLARVASIAEALADLSAEVVFIGGAIAPLLQTDPVIPHVRPTTDVDAVVASTSYMTFHEFQARLATRGFKHAAQPKHAHRWLAPDGTPFDIVPAGVHLGGSGNEWDQMALETAVETQLPRGVRIRHASAMGFLSQKWAAFWDRGAEDPHASADLEDIIALIVARPAIVDDFGSAAANMQQHVCRGLRWLRDNPSFEDLIAGHLATAVSFRDLRTSLLDRIQQMTEMCEKPQRQLNTHDE